MWNKVGVEKDAVRIMAVIEDLRRIRRDMLPRMGAKSRTRRANYEWLDAVDAINMIDAAELIALSSLERKESRGPFMRVDFPTTDNDMWLAANVLIKDGDGVRFERRPYDTPFFQPGFGRRDNLEVPW